MERFPNPKNLRVTKLPYLNSWRHKINLTKAPISTRELDGFLWANNAAKCFMKGQGGWYKLTREGTLLYVCRTLYLLSFQEWYDIAVDDNFIANMK